MALNLPGKAIFNLFKDSEDLGEGIRGLTVEDEESFRVSTLAESEIETDLPTTDTTILESGILEPGTYLITAGLNCDVSTDSTNYGAAQIWLENGSTEIPGTRRGQSIYFTTTDSLEMSMNTSIIASFKGRTSVSLMAKEIEAKGLAKERSLSWYKLSSDY